MKLYNTLSRTIEHLHPSKPPVITFYSCGPTVYDYTHIGHLRTYINNDILKRTLNYCGFNVNHVMNITDVGHLTGDDDSGEDKLEKGATKTGKTVWEVAEFYTDYFKKTVSMVNVLPVDNLIKATDHITDIIDLIKQLEKKGYTYKTQEALYFDITKFPDYGKLSGQKLEEKTIGARQEVHVDKNKKHPADFALWFFRVGRFSDHIMYWDSPWGDGFPGWHIECSAMSMKYLGETIDIHAGGVDHITVHHENEIAQSEAATGIPFVRYWFHNNFLLVNHEKMSKSLENIITLENITKKNIDPLALRYLFLQTHYRQIQNFTWESIESSQIAYNRIKEIILELKKQLPKVNLSNRKITGGVDYETEFKKAMATDLQSPQALATLWEMIKSDISPFDKVNLIRKFDQILGLGLAAVKERKVPKEIVILANEREMARKQGDFLQSDSLRKKIADRGYFIEDDAEGYRLKKIT